MSLTSLTALNARLIAQETSTAVEEVAEGTGLVIGPEGMQPEDPDTDEEERESPEVRGRFSTVNPREFQRIKEWIEIQIFGGENPVSSSLTNLFINEWDQQWAREQLLAVKSSERGLRPSLAQIGNPTLEDLMNDERFLNGAIWLPLTATNEVPPLFESTVTDEETGEERIAVAVSSPLTGVEFIEIEPDLSSLKQRPQTLFETVRRTGTDLIRRAMGGGVGTNDEAARAAQAQASALGGGSRVPAAVDEPGAPRPSRESQRFAEINQGPSGGKPRLPGYIRTAILYRDGAAEGREPQAPLPVIRQPDLVNTLIRRTSGGGGGRGGGGGGTARRELVFDKDHLISQVEDRWNSWMLEGGEPPSGTVGSWVDGYIREAKAFWSGKGGQLDFDTYITNKFEAHPRFQLIYKDKLPAESPEQYLQKWMQPISGLGMTNDFTREQTEASILSGGAQEGQFDRVRQMREVQVSRQGDFSQRLAQTLAGIGVG